MKQYQDGMKEFINKLDRIYVKSNERMEFVIDWYLQHKNLAFNSAMDSGLTILEEEHLALAFAYHTEYTGISVLIGDPDDVIFSLKNIKMLMHIRYDPHKDKVLRADIMSPKSVTSYEKTLLKHLIAQDNTVGKEVIKYRALMIFMSNYREIIPVKTQISKNPSKTVAKKHKNKAKKPQKLIQKVYVLDDIKSASIERIQLERRGYSKPAEEVKVRGHYRHLKTGKTVWVRPHSKYTDKESVRKDYEL